MMPKRGCDVTSCEISRFYRLNNSGLCQVMYFFHPKECRYCTDIVVGNHHDRTEEIGTVSRGLVSGHPGGHRGAVGRRLGGWSGRGARVNFPQGRVQTSGIQIGVGAEEEQRIGQDAA